MLKHEHNIIRTYTETTIAQDLLVTSAGKERFSSFAAASASKKNKKTAGHKGEKKGGNIARVRVLSSLHPALPDGAEHAHNPYSTAHRDSNDGDPTREKASERKQRMNKKRLGFLTLP